MSFQLRRVRAGIGAALCAGALFGCGDAQFVFAFVSIGGTIHGLGPGLTIVIANNGVDFLTINSPGDFSFPQTLSNGSRYEVTVAMQPKGQDCTVIGGDGVAISDINSITIDCVASQAALSPVAPEPVGNAPAARSGAAVAAGWLFGGRGQAADGDAGCLNDLWRYDADSRLWVWLSGADVAGSVGSSDEPAAREQASMWLDRAGNLWLFGGGCPDANGELSVRNDLWRFDTRTQLWTRLSPPDSPPARAQ